MWHMDGDWKGLRDYTPWVKKLPSDYLRQNIRFGSQPMPNAPTKADLKTLLNWMWADETLLFASEWRIANCEVACHLQPATCHFHSSLLTFT